MSESIQKIIDDLKEFGKSFDFYNNPYRNIELTNLPIKAVKGRLFPFINMSVDEAGTVFIGNAEPLASQNDELKGFYVTDITSLFDEVFFSSFSTAQCLLAVQVYALTYDFNKMKSVLFASQNSKLCVTQAVIDKSFDMTTTGMTEKNKINMASFLNTVLYLRNAFLRLAYQLQKEQPYIVGTPEQSRSDEQKAICDIATSPVITNLFLMTATTSDDKLFLEGDKKAGLSSFFLQTEKSPYGLCCLDSSALEDIADEMPDNSTDIDFSRKMKPIMSATLDNLALALSYHVKKEIVEKVSQNVYSNKSLFTKEQREDIKAKAKLQLLNQLDKGADIVYSTNIKETLKDSPLQEFIATEDLTKCLSSTASISNRAMFYMTTTSFVDYIKTNTTNIALYSNRLSPQTNIDTDIWILARTKELNLLKKFGKLLKNAL